ncbi:MAG: hypothetical protein WKG01_05035 [Kofleriaceae bacterium]
MKKLTLIAATSLFTTSLFACGGSDLTDDDDTPPIDAPPPVDLVVRIPGGDLSGDITWEAEKTYILEGYVFLTSGTLTIEPGATVKGENGSALTITKDAKLNAVGTATQPIVFTSNKTPAAPGDWGGIVMLGKAPINVAGGINKVEGFPDSYGDRIVYGTPAPAAADPAHDCGKISYARVEYAGFLLSTDNELNGLTIAGCGSATKVDYVQVHLGQDDGVEVFGGTVNLSHLVITQPDDDGLDWDLGWTGNAQFVVIQQKTGRGDKAIEADSNRNDNELRPRSAPEIWNVTMIGGDGAAVDPQGGIHLRRGTAGKVSNAIVAYFTKFAVDLDGTSTVNQFGTGLTIKHTYFVKGTASTAIWPAGFDVGSNGMQNDGGFDEAAQIGGDATNHLGVDVQLTAPKDLAAPNWKPAAASPVLAGCGTPSAGLDTTATFCGAIGATDWTIGWTKY